MPKTKRRPQRQADTDAWSSDSDDEKSLPRSSKPSSKNVSAVRQRYYGKGRPVKKTRQEDSYDASVAAQDSSLKKRPSSSTFKPSSTKPPTNDDTCSEENSLQAPKKPSSNKSKRVFVEDKVDSSSSSSDGDESSMVVPAKSRTSLSTFSRRSSFKSDQHEHPHLYPAFTPIVPDKKKKRARTPIRVNLTPEYNSASMPHGWLAKSQLLDVARKHNGMAIQYRVMYHQSQKPIRDNNAGAIRKIRYKDLVVQTRFACTTGSSGGSTYSFMKWKLPGTLLQSRKAQHVTIYDDTRPRLLSDRNKNSQTSHPVIILCSELKEADCRMAKRFLCHAKAGMTPSQFYSSQDGNESPNHQSDQQENDDDMHEGSPRVSQDEDSSSDEEEENEEPPAKRLASKVVSSVATDANKGKSRRRKQSTTIKTRRPLRDQNSSERQTSSSKTKRGRDTERDAKTAKTTKRARNKGYGGGRSRRSKQVNFQIGENDAVPQFIALVEGVAGAKPGTRVPDDKAQDYIRDVFMNGRVEELPQAGRMLELPGEAKAGTWTAELVNSKAYPASTLSANGLMRDKIGSLKNIRIQIRHESAKDMASLNLSRHHDNGANSPAACLEQRIRGGGEGSQSVSMIDPSHGRKDNFLAQGIVSRETLEGAFIGSISIVGFDGFTSSAEARLSAEGKSKSLLESCRKQAIAIETQRLDNKSTLEDVLPIPDPDSERNVGVSFLCKMSLDDSSYALLVANDENGQIVAIDVVFDASLIETGRSSISSTSSYQDEPSRLTEKSLFQHAKDMELAVSENQNTSDEYSEEQMIFGDQIKASPASSSSARSKQSSCADTSSAPTSNKEDSVDTVVTSNLSPSANRLKDTRVGKINPTYTPHTDAAITAAITVPRSILKKKNLIGQVTLAASAANEVRKNNAEEFVGLAFITPAPGRKRQNDEPNDNTPHDMLSQLDQAVEALEKSGDVPSDEDEFSDPVNENLSDVFEAFMGQNQIAVDELCTNRQSQPSGWPSIHDVFHGVHDERALVECTLEDMRTSSGVTEEEAKPSFLTVLAEFLWGEEDEYEEYAPDSSAASCSRRGASFSSIRLLGIVGLVLLSSLFPVENDLDLVTKVPHHSPVVETRSFAKWAMEQDRDSTQESWTNRFW